MAIRRGISSADNFGTWKCLIKVFYDLLLASCFRETSVVDLIEPVMPTDVDSDSLKSSI